MPLPVCLRFKVNRRFAETYRDSTWSRSGSDQWQLNRLYIKLHVHCNRIIPPDWRTTCWNDSCLANSAWSCFLIHLRGMLFAQTATVTRLWNRWFLRKHGLVIPLWHGLLRWIRVNVHHMYIYIYILRVLMIRRLLSPWKIADILLEVTSRTCHSNLNKISKNFASNKFVLLKFNRGSTLYM